MTTCSCSYYVHTAVQKKGSHSHCGYVHTAYRKKDYTHTDCSLCVGRRNFFRLSCVMQFIICTAAAVAVCRRKRTARVVRDPSCSAAAAIKPRRHRVAAVPINFTAVSRRIAVKALRCVRSNCWLLVAKKRAVKKASATSKRRDDKDRGRRHLKIFRSS